MGELEIFDELPAGRPGWRIINGHSERPAESTMHIVALLIEYQQELPAQFEGDIREGLLRGTIQRISQILEKYIESGRISSVIGTRLGALGHPQGGASGVLPTGSATVHEQNQRKREITLLSDKTKEAVKEALSTREKSLELLIEAGIYDQDGELTEGYQTQEMLKRKGSR